MDGPPLIGRGAELGDGRDSALSDSDGDTAKLTIPTSVETQKAGLGISGDQTSFPPAPTAAGPLLSVYASGFMGAGG